MTLDYFNFFFFLLAECGFEHDLNGQFLAQLVHDLSNGRFYVHSLFMDIQHLRYRSVKQDAFTIFVKFDSLPHNAHNDSNHPPRARGSQPRTSNRGARVTVGHLAHLATILFDKKKKHEARRVCKICMFCFCFC